MELSRQLKYEKLYRDEALKFFSLFLVLLFLFFYFLHSEKAVVCVVFCRQLVVFVLVPYFVFLFFLILAFVLVDGRRLVVTSH